MAVCVVPLVAMNLSFRVHSSISDASAFQPDEDRPLPAYTDLSGFGDPSDEEDASAMAQQETDVLRGGPVPATPLVTPARLANASASQGSLPSQPSQPPSSHPSADGRGKWKRSGHKGKHATWNERASTHLNHLSNATWAAQRPCDGKCAFGQRCFSRLTENDVRDCAEFTFGHSDPSMPPTNTHTEATQQWFKTVSDSRLFDASTQSITGFAFKLVHGSGVEVCSLAASWLYGCSRHTWGAMMKAVLAGETSWNESKSIITLNQAKKWAETKHNDSVRLPPLPPILPASPLLRERPMGKNDLCTLGGRRRGGWIGSARTSVCPMLRACSCIHPVLWLTSSRKSSGLK